MGKLKWYFQTVHHDLWDSEGPCHPILAHITENGKKVDVVIQTTKQGFIFMFDRVTGKPIHPIKEVSVPQSKLVGEFTSPTQPVPTFFALFVRQRLTEDDLLKEGISEESYQDLLKRFRALDHDNMWNSLHQNEEPFKVRGGMAVPNGAGRVFIPPPNHVHQRQ